MDEKNSGIYEEIERELYRAHGSYGRFCTPHEGYAVLLEEVDELWAEVKKRPNVISRDALRKEALQVAAMAVRFILECAS